MAQSKYTLNLSNTRTKIRTYTEQGKDVLFSAIFITGKEKSKLVERAPVKQLSLITRNLKYECPEKVRIELYDGKESVNPLWLKEYELLQPVADEKPDQTGFRGLGEMEINQIVDERFRERQRLAEYEQLKERVLELTAENEELRDTIEELENHSNQIEGELENKRQIRYYAGMLGDILESFGIAKDRVKRPLAQLMGMGDGDEAPKLPPAKEDASGIAEPLSDQGHSSEERKRAEIISLVAEYLKTTPNEVLAAIFSIFSEVEQDNSLAGELIQYINQRRKEKSGKV